MNDILPAWPQLSAFLLASLVLAVTPGPGVTFIVTRSLGQGRRVGMASVTGVALGNLGNAVAAVAFIAIAAVTDSAYAWAAGSVAPALARARGVQVASRYLTGGVFIGLGLFTALSGTRTAR